MPGPQGCEKLYSPLGLVRHRARITFLAVRWLEKQTYLFKRDGGAFSSGNSTLMQRERVKQINKSK